jgi:predicted nucleotidyltransferase
MGLRRPKLENTKLRRRIAWEAARLMYQRQESEYYRAKMKAARQFCRGWVKPADLPSNAEIRDQIQLFARLYEGDQRTTDLQRMRLAALGMMRLLARFRPRLIGSVLTGHIRKGSDIDLHVFSDSVEAVAHVLDEAGLVYDVERKQVRKHGEERVYQHIHIAGEHEFELTIYAANLAHYVFKSSITGKAIERASIAQLEQFLNREYPELDVDAALSEAAEQVDRFQLYETLLLPLENVKQNPKYHPEGDALFHSLQVFDLACDELPYDEEFLTAALLHDVGKGIDPSNHVAAALEALDGFVTERTAWLIEHHMLAHLLAEGTLGWRNIRRLKESGNFDELELLGRCDRGGRQRGVEVPDLDEAITYLRELSHMCSG